MTNESLLPSDMRLTVTIDKSHLVAIGERLYAESVELLRELVNNSCDADASEVHVGISEHEIFVSDNGSGMDLDVVERRLLETLPLQAKDFIVFLNGKKLVPRVVEGRRLPILEGTPYGVIHGELIIRPASRGEASEAGILVRIKQVAVARLPFDLEGESLARISGKVKKIDTQRDD